MKSLTVHLRLDLLAIISCGDLMAKSDIDPKTQPMGSIVRSAMEVMAEFLRASGQVPDYEDYGDEQLINRYNELFTEQITDATELTFGEIDTFIKSKESRTPEDAIRRIAEQVGETIEKPSIPSIEAGTDETEGGEIPEEEHDLFKLEGLGWDMILLKAEPNDPLIALVKKESEPLLRRALEVTYGSLDINAWGTQQAKNMMNRLVQAHPEEED